jgi:hypothetical protein
MNNFKDKTLKAADRKYRLPRSLLHRPARNRGW